MVYEAITDGAQLPPVGPLAEGLRLDMKLLIRPEGVQDLACDVAAFANTQGGVLLVGAHEHPKDSGILSGYRPMSQVDANEIGAILRKALDLCSPRPIAEARPIPRDNGYVVAINCDAYSAPPIGVAQEGQSGGEKWWAFPTRRGRDNRNLRPEELATVMEPRLRRVALLLARIPVLGANQFSIASFHSTHGEIESFKIVSIDHEASAVVLRSMRDNEVVVPLDGIRMIWRSGDGRPQVSLDGRIEGYEFYPKEKVR